jgi:hypothetical protein
VFFLEMGSAQLSCEDAGGYQYTSTLRNDQDNLGCVDLSMANEKARQNNSPSR